MVLRAPKGATSGVHGSACYRVRRDHGEACVNREGRSLSLRSADERAESVVPPDGRGRVDPEEESSRSAVADQESC